MRRSFFLICLTVTYVSQVFAQSGNYQQDFNRKGNSFYFTTTAGKVQLEFCTASIFRVRMSRTGHFAANEPWMVVNSPPRISAARQQQI